MRPTQQNERIVFLDILRGFALLGVLVANMGFHSGYWFLLPETKQSVAQYEQGETLLWLIHFITEGKFYSIFSLLFGVGFGLQIQRAMANKVSFTGLFSRRLSFLLLFGLLHAMFLFVGDILVLYALLGFVLIFFRNMSNKNILRLVFLLPIIPVLQYAVVWAMAQGAPVSGEISGKDMFEQIILTYQSGSFSDIVMTNTFGFIFGRFPDLIFTGRFFKVFAMFLLGFYLARNEWFITIHQRKAQIKRIMYWCAGIGIPCNLILAQMMTTNAYYTKAPSGIIEPVVYAFGVPALGLFYACGLALLYQKNDWKKKLNILAPFGKMALTNYLGQSLICCLIFKSYGLGYFGQIGPLYFTLIGLGILIFQIGFSKWWLSHFKFGPAEWLWRSLTYKKFQPFKTQVIQQIDDPLKSKPVKG